MSKTLDRITLLLAQAEGASTPEEAAAYTEKAQALATAAAVDLEVARQRQVDRSKREAPVQRTIRVADYVGSRVQNNAAENVGLFSVIAGANDVSIDIYRNSTHVIAYGFPSDIDVVEALYSSLVVQRSTMADAAIKAGEHKNDGGERYFCERTWQYKVRRPDARRFRTSFYTGFNSRIGERLRKARNEALEAAKKNTFDLDVQSDDGAVQIVQSDGALVLVEKAVEVRSFYKQTSNARGSYRGGSNRSYTSSGLGSGRAAGDRARLGNETAIGGSRKAVSA